VGLPGHNLRLDVLAEGIAEQPVPCRSLGEWFAQWPLSAITPEPAGSDASRVAKGGQRILFVCAESKELRQTRNFKDLHEVFPQAAENQLAFDGLCLLVQVQQHTERGRRKELHFAEVQDQFSAVHLVDKLVELLGDGVDVLGIQQPNLLEIDDGNVEHFLNHDSRNWIHAKISLPNEPEFPSKPPTAIVLNVTFDQRNRVERRGTTGPCVSAL